MNNETNPQELTAAVVEAEGDLVSPKLAALRSKFRELVDAGTVHLTLDLASTHMVDSAGIGLLMSAHNTLKKAGGELTVIHASKDIIELFRTMRIHKHLSVSGD